MGFLPRQQNIYHRRGHGGVWEPILRLSMRKTRLEALLKKDEQALHAAILWESLQRRDRFLSTASLSFWGTPNLDFTRASPEQLTIFHSSNSPRLMTLSAVICPAFKISDKDISI